MSLGRGVIGLASLAGFKSHNDRMTKPSLRGTACVRSRRQRVGPLRLSAEQRWSRRDRSACGSGRCETGRSRCLDRGSWLALARSRFHVRWARCIDRLARLVASRSAAETRRLRRLDRIARHPSTGLRARGEVGPRSDRRHVFVVSTRHCARIGSLRVDWVTRILSTGNGPRGKIRSSRNPRHILIVPSRGGARSRPLRVHGCRRLRAGRTCGSTCRSWLLPWWKWDRSRHAFRGCRRRSLGEGICREDAERGAEGDDLGGTHRSS